MIRCEDVLKDVQRERDFLYSKVQKYESKLSTKIKSRLVSYKNKVKRFFNRYVFLIPVNKFFKIRHPFRNPFVSTGEYKKWCYETKKNFNWIGYSWYELSMLAHNNGAGINPFEEACIRNERLYNKGRRMYFSKNHKTSNERSLWKDFCVFLSHINLNLEFTPNKD